MNKAKEKREVANGVGSVFGPRNYMLVVAGVILIVVGFILMSGGAPTDPNVFDASEVYSFRRITLAPIVVLLGYGLELYAIFHRFDQSSHQS